MANRITDFFKRINGFSTPFIGTQWIPNADEKKIIYNFLIFLKGRRILRYDHGKINKNAAIESLSNIRNEATSTIQSLNYSSNHIDNLIIFRKIIEEFQSSIESSLIDNLGNVLLEPRNLLELNKIRVILDSYLTPFIIDEKQFQDLIEFKDDNFLIL